MRCQIKPLSDLSEVRLLYQIYHFALTPIQNDYMDFYLNEDFSLQEIATFFKVSKTAIFDALKKANYRLYDLESQFHLLSHYRLLSDLNYRYQDSDNLEIKLILERFKAIWGWGF